jgi:hypothetical protein
MRFFKYFFRLIREFGAFAWQRKAWWILPILAILLLLTLLIVAGSTIAPFIYPLF